MIKKHMPSHLRINSQNMNFDIKRKLSELNKSKPTIGFESKNASKKYFRDDSPELSASIIKNSAAVLPPMPNVRSSQQLMSYGMLI